ncbi:hypothetical protein PPERSA_01610 [Pseudocohnilembus persalinus]|uniref:Uncharacterized protein n=1 Tax=Pseudocohnilembus persalinus TaxID=266149 RepID=A0A0V0QHT4_PSEPJ|nr:hypothetical protein PPERSA_01610 [Pseudocohnilembus persalinus]|eukprot:KRX01740.1 hypothetical protein PPERSA_01610 [Pseudocohnilembus persalinus]
MNLKNQDKNSIQQIKIDEYGEELQEENHGNIINNEIILNDSNLEASYFNFLEQNKKENIIQNRKKDVQNLESLEKQNFNNLLNDSMNILQRAKQTPKTDVEMKVQFLEQKQNSISNPEKWAQNRFWDNRFIQQPKIIYD